MACVQGHVQVFATEALGVCVAASCSPWQGACLHAALARVAPPTHLGHQAAIDNHRGTAIKVQPPAVAALLVGIQVDAARLGCGAHHQLQALQEGSAAQVEAPLAAHIGRDTLGGTCSIR